MASKLESLMLRVWFWLIRRDRARRDRARDPFLPRPAPPVVVAKEGSAVASAWSPPLVSTESERQAFLEMLGGAVSESAAKGMAEKLVAGAMRRELTLGALGQLQQIPVLQSFAQNFLKILNQTDVDVSDVVGVIAKDSALCVRILRMANSVLVSSERRIDDLDSAVQMLGLGRVRKAAQALFMLRDGKRVADGFDWRHLWIHAIATSSIAEELEKRLRGEAPPALHVAALLHDVGKIVLSTVAADEYRAILVATWQERGRLEDLERARLGVDHREAGVLFARQSGMAEMVVQAIAHHDQPEQAKTFRFEVALISLANYLSKAHGLGFSGSRIEASDGEFANLSAWKIVAERVGYMPDVEALEAEMVPFIGEVRADLREMREASER